MTCLLLLLAIHARVNLFAQNSLYRAQIASILRAHILDRLNSYTNQEHFFKFYLNFLLQLSESNNTLFNETVYLSEYVRVSNASLLTIKLLNKSLNKDTCFPNRYLPFGYIPNFHDEPV
jgi:hypothetical protein